jgi:hypothetical protein
MKRHKFNIFPEAKQEDYQRLKQDIETNGFDESQPIFLYQGDILDGWNRQKACDEIGVAARYEHFVGNDEEALAFMMRTNKRRNMNSGQWATVAVEAEEVLAAIRKQVETQANLKRSEAAKRIAESAKINREREHFKEASTRSFSEHKERQSTQKIVDTPRQEKESAHKAAELFNTNRTYVNQAAKLKVEAPEIFDKVKAGTMRMTDATKAVKAIPKDDWRADERERQLQCKSGCTVVANSSKDQNLIRWAESMGKAVRIDRGTKYGNPFVLGADGDRDAVCDCYEKHYLPNKPSILNDANSLAGKVLVCHCYPDRCHGDSLVKLTSK